MAAAWEEQFGKPDRACGGAREDPRASTIATSRRYASSSACTGRSGARRSWSRRCAGTSSRRTTRRCASISTRRWARSTRRSCKRHRSRDRGLQRHPHRSTRDEHARSTRSARLYEKIEEWDRAIEPRARLVELTDDSRTRVELHQRIGRIYEERLRRSRDRRGALRRGARARPVATCRRWSR